MQFEDGSMGTVLVLLLSFHPSAMAIHTTFQQCKQVYGCHKCGNASEWVRMVLPTAQSSRVSMMLDDGHPLLPIREGVREGRG